VQKSGTQVGTRKKGGAVGSESTMVRENEGLSLEPQKKILWKSGSSGETYAQLKKGIVGRCEGYRGQGARKRFVFLGGVVKLSEDLKKMTCEKW